MLVGEVAISVFVVGWSLHYLVSVDQPQICVFHPKRGKAVVRLHVYPVTVLSVLYTRDKCEFQYMLVD